MINRCCRILQRQKLVFGGMVCFLTCKHHFEKWKFSSKLLVLEANFSFETSLYQKFKNTCIPLVKIPHPTPDKVQRCLRQRWLFNTYWLPVPPGGGRGGWRVELNKGNNHWQKKTNSPHWFRVWRVLHPAICFLDWRVAVSRDDQHPITRTDYPA